MVLVGLVVKAAFTKYLSDKNFSRKADDGQVFVYARSIASCFSSP